MGERKSRRLALMKEFVESLGGQLIELDSLKFNEFIEDGIIDSLAPFNSAIGIHYDGKRISYHVESKNKSPKIGDLIHEAGHIFASLKPPSVADEVSFFGWEYAVAKKLGFLGAWKAASKTYMIDGDGTEFGSLSVEEQSIFLEGCLDQAYFNKLISQTHEPLSVR